MICPPGFTAVKKITASLLVKKKIVKHVRRAAKVKAAKVVAATSFVCVSVGGVGITARNLWPAMSSTGGLLTPNTQMAPTAVPEPSSIILLAVPLAVTAVLYIRKR